MKDTLHNIHEIYPTLSNAKKAVANYFLNYYQDIPFKTVTTLASEIGVSDTTIINLCTELGFDGFSSFKRTVKEYVQAEVLTFQKFSENIHNVHDHSSSSIIDLILNQELANIHSTLSNDENRVNLDKLMEMIHQANKIYIIGFRSSAMMAQLLGFNLRQQAIPVEVITSGIGDFMDKIISISGKDLIIAFSFARYSADSLRTLNVLKSKGVPIVGITDMGPSLIYQYSDLIFQCLTKSNTYVDSFTSCFSLINVITTLCSLTRKEQTTQTLKELEKMFAVFETFGEQSSSNMYKWNKSLEIDDYNK